MVTLAVVLLAKVARRRRVVCLNFVMTSDRLLVEEQDLFTANQIVQLRPVAGRGTYEAFLAANTFVRGYYPNFDADLRAPLSAEPGRWASVCKRLAERLLRWPAPLLESASRSVYIRHLKRRAHSWNSPAEVRLQPGYVKLHTHSHRRSVMERFDDVCRAALQAPVAPEPERSDSTRPFELAH
jgi:hypothetical protein